MMMVASLVVRSGCGTPLWLRGGKGGGIEVFLKPIADISCKLAVLYWLLYSIAKEVISH